MNDLSYETATAIVFIDRERRLAFKRRKPVGLGYLDYSTLALRWRATRRELKLGRRYSENTYVGIWSQKASGEFVEDEIEDLEPVLVMRFLDEADRLDAPRNQTVSVARRLAGELVRHHAAAHPDTRIDGYGSVASVREHWEVNFREILPRDDPRLPIDPSDRAHIISRMDAWLIRQDTWLKERIHTGRIRDLHGDLRVEHVYVGDEIHIIDPLEFRDDWRITDVAAELAFLTMELDSLGAQNFARALIAEYVERSQDRDLPTLLPYYKTYYAVVRARVAWIRYLQTEGQDAAELQKSASHFQQALQYVLDDLSTD